MNNSSLLTADRMTGAVHLARFFAAHYRAAITTITTDTTTETARYILGVLITKTMTTFTRRELHRRCHRQLPKATDVTTVIDTLTALGWIRPTADGRYQLHPTAAEHAATGDTVTRPPDNPETAGQTTSEPVTAPGDTR